MAQARFESRLLHYAVLLINYNRTFLPQPKAKHHMSAVFLQKIWWPSRHLQGGLQSQTVPRLHSLFIPFSNRTSWIVEEGGRLAPSWKAHSPGTLAARCGHVTMFESMGSQKTWEKVGGHLLKHKLLALTSSSPFLLAGIWKWRQTRSSHVGEDTPRGQRNNKMEGI